MGAVVSSHILRGEDQWCGVLPPEEIAPSDGGEEVLYGPMFKYASESAGPRYRKIGLNGFPLPDEKPQKLAESDSQAEETYIDAFSHGLTHQVTDVYIPFEGTDLALSVRRNWNATVWRQSDPQFNYLKPTARNVEHPFGTGWSSNLGAHAKFDANFDTNTVNANVLYYVSLTDENGVRFRFLKMPLASGGVKYYPMPASRTEQDVFATSLERVDRGTLPPQYILTKKYGTKLTYERVPVISGGVDYGQTQGLYSEYARLVKIEDQKGTVMEMGFPAANAVQPTSLTCRGKTLTIAYSGNRVSRVTDPAGNTIDYSYGDYTIPIYEGGVSHETAGSLTGVSRSQGATTTYGYDLAKEADFVPVEGQGVGELEHFFYFDLGSITDANANTTTFSYQFDHSRVISLDGYLPGEFLCQHGNPRNVTNVWLPDGKHSTFVNNSRVWISRDNEQDPMSTYSINGNRTFLVKDAETQAEWGYSFGDAVLIRLNEFEQLCTTNGNLPDSAFPIMIMYREMTVSTPGGGTMVAKFDSEAGMALKSFKDVSSTVPTTFAHTDPFNFQFVNPWIATFPASVANQIPQKKWEDPTSQTNGLGKTKSFEYDAKWRVMKKITDEAGRVTEYVIDPANGNRLKETIKAADNTVVKETDFEYGNANFPGILTAKVVKKLSGDPSWAVDLRTDYEIDATTGSILKEKVGTVGGQRVSEYAYDANNNKVSTKDPNGNVTAFVYDSHNRLKEVDPPGPGKKVFTYDARGNKIVEQDENGNQTLREYDGLNRVVKEARDMNGNGQIDSADLVTETTYNGLNAKTSVKSPNGHTTGMTYDALNRLVKTTDALANETTFEYGTNSGGLQFGRDFQPTKVVNPRGFQTLTTYDASFRPTSRKAEYKKDSQSQPVFAETTFEYDDVGNLTQETDPLGHLTVHAYDALNRETLTTNPDLTTRQTFYTAAGLVWKTIDERDKDTLTEYDDAGRPVKVSSPPVDNGYGATARAVTQTAYDAAGNVIQTTNPLSKIWTFTYDNRNRKLTEVRPGTGTPTLHWTYDNVGNVVKITDARNHETDTTYDVANRVVKMEEPSVPISGGGSTRPTTEKEYDKNGNVTKLTDPNDHDTVNTYDALNRLLTSTDAEGIVVENEYDAVGNRVAVIDGKDQRTGFAYDGLNRNTTITDALAKVTTFEYDAMNKTARVDAMSQRTEYGYDLRNRLLTVNYVGRTQDNRALSYDETGNLLAVVEATPTKSVAYTYDALKRQVTETSGGLTHNYGYDLAGNRIYCLYGGLSVPLVSAYDEQNRLTTLTQGTLVTTYAYDANGNVLLKTLPNGDKATSVYDAANRTSSLTGSTGANTALYAYGYEYDAGGNVKKVTETYANTSMDRVVANAYDDINRLTTETVTGSGASTTTFGYDDANNRETMSKGGVNTAYTYNANNQLTGFTEGSRSVGFGYDDNGNRVTRTEGTATDTFAWDYENRLVGLTKASTGGIGTYAWAYDYRTRRVNFTTPTSPLTQVVFSGGTSVREIENGVPTVDYVRGSDWGGGVGGILYSLRAGVPSFTHYNRRGDVTAKTSANGTITYQAEYEAFGKRTSETGATLDRQKSNTKDEDIPGYANEGFRFRDLESGTFLSKDPIGYTLMQPADKWFLDGHQVTAQEYAEATLPWLVKEDNPNPTQTAKESSEQTQFDAYVKSERTIPGEKSHWHIAEPGQSNIYAYCLDNPWSKFDPEGLEPHFLDKNGNAMSGSGVDLSMHSQSITKDPQAHPRNAWDNKATFTLMGHGYGAGKVPPFIVDQRALKSGDKTTGVGVANVSPNQLAAIIENNSHWQGSTSVIMYTCQAGMDGKNSFAQKLANRLRVPVWAPTDKLQYSNGKTPGKSTGIANGGKWQEFKPDKPKKKKD